MNMKSILNEKDYDNALDRVDVLMNMETLNTEQSDELEMLVLRIEKYEEKAWAISEPSL